MARKGLIRPCMASSGRVPIYLEGEQKQDWGDAKTGRHREDSKAFQRFFKAV